MNKLPFLLSEQMLTNRGERIAKYIFKLMLLANALCLSLFRFEIFKLTLGMYYYIQVFLNIRKVIQITVTGRATSWARFTETTRIHLM